MYKRFLFSFFSKTLAEIYQSLKSKISQTFTSFVK